MLAAHPDGVQDASISVEPRAAIASFGPSPRPLQFQQDDFTLCVSGHPRLRDVTPADLAPELARRLRERGPDTLAQLGGDFALAAFDHRSGRGWLAVDRLAVRRLVYAALPHGIAFGSSLDLIGGHPQVHRALSSQSIYDYLYYHVVPGPETIFEGQFVLGAGECIEFGPDGARDARPYWRMVFTETGGEDVAALKQQFTSLLEQSVREASDTEDCGTFLSGGTDSSTVTGMLGRVRATAPRSFSIGFDVAGYDETGYARIAAKHYGCDHHEYFVTPHDVVDAAPKIAAAYDQPFGNSSAIPTYYCARLARESGVRRLLAGDGGDELFGGNERYGKQHLLSLYHRLPAPLRRLLIEPLVHSVPGVAKVPPLRKLRSYVDQASPAMPLRYESYNLLQHLGVEHVLTPSFLADVDVQHPRSVLAQAHAPYAGASLINQMLGIDLRLILADGDLPKVTGMCDLAGVDVTFPLLDDRLVEFSRHLPSPLKLRGTKLRWFFKQALSDFLPHEIITKQKHGFGLPVGQWLLDHAPLRELARQSIDSLQPRGIVRPAFVDELVGKRLPEHPGYYGTMVWILMMLGLWLDSRRL